MSSPATPTTFVSVTQSGTFGVTWVFSSPCVSVADFTGFTVAADPPNGGTLNGDGTITTTYDVPTAIGQAWFASMAATDAVFASGQPFVDTAGIVS